MRNLQTAKFILPALTEATSPYWRPIKYSLFPPLGLATLAAYLNSGIEATLVDEHVEPLKLDDSPDLVVIQVYITNAYRAYRIADHKFYRGPNIIRGSLQHSSTKHSLKHFFYTSGWKKLERLWNLAIRMRQLRNTRPLLEAILSKVTASDGPRSESPASEPKGLTASQL